MELNEMAPLSVDPAWYDAPETWHSFVGPIDLSTARADEVEVWGELAAVRQVSGASAADADPVAVAASLAGR